MCIGIKVSIKTLLEAKWEEEEEKKPDSFLFSQEMSSAFHFRNIHCQRVKSSVSEIYTYVFNWIDISRHWLSNKYLFGSFFPFIIITLAHTVFDVRKIIFIFSIRTRTILVIISKVSILQLINTFLQCLIRHEFAE